MMQYIHRLRNIHNQTTAISRQIIPVDIEVEYFCAVADLGGGGMGGMHILPSA